MPFQREYYNRPTSPASIAAYHATSGYLSPPCSDPRRPTAEDTFMPSMTGLGITHPYMFQLHQQHQDFYTVKQEEHPKFSIDVQRGFPSSERTLPPQQAGPFSLPPYTQRSRNSSYHMTPGHDHSPPHHSPSMLVQIARRNDWEPSSYGEHMMPPSNAGILEPHDFRYHPDTSQDDRWTAASRGVAYTMSREPSSVTVWHTDGFNQNVYHHHHQYAVSDGFLNNGSMLITLDSPFCKNIFHRRRVTSNVLVDTTRITGMHAGARSRHILCSCAS